MVGRDSTLLVARGAAAGVVVDGGGGGRNLVDRGEIAAGVFGVGGDAFPGLRVDGDFDQSGGADKPSGLGVAV